MGCLIRGSFHLCSPNTPTARPVPKTSPPTFRGKLRHHLEPCQARRGRRRTVGPYPHGMCCPCPPQMSPSPRGLLHLAPEQFPWAGELQLGQRCQAFRGSQALWGSQQDRGGQQRTQGKAGQVWPCPLLGATTKRSPTCLKGGQDAPGTVTPLPRQSVGDTGLSATAQGPLQPQAPCPAPGHAAEQRFTPCTGPS